MALILWCIAIGWFLVWKWAGRSSQFVVGTAAGATGGDELVSILVSARNEENRVLRAAIESMLGQSYPHLEVIVVDDRSTDRTLEILRSIEHARLTVIQGSQPPADCVGKPYGLLQAMEKAKGSWILITDADILFHPDAVAIAKSIRADVVSFWPLIECDSFWERLIMPLDLAITAILFPVQRVNWHKHRDAFTIGGFTLVRREALERIGGFRAVRRDVADDFALGILLKKAGYRLYMGFAPELLRTRDYSGFAQIWEGMTRKLFSNFIYIPSIRAFREKFSAVEEWRGKHRRLFRWSIGAAAIVAGGATIGVSLLPIFWLGTLPGFLAYLMMCRIHREYARLNDVGWYYSLLAPVGYVSFAAILLVAAWRVQTGRGLTWRGRRIY